MNNTKLGPVAKAIRSARIKLKFTREQLANILAISLDEYISIETGKSYPSEQREQDLADFFQMDKKHFKKKFEVMKETDTSDEDGGDDCA